jgi:hypothetical protein
MKAKGVGELGICGVGAAVANAIYNATGVRIRELSDHDRQAARSDAPRWGEVSSMQNQAGGVKSTPPAFSFTVSA